MRKPGIFLRLLAWRRGGDIIWMRTLSGEVFLSIAETSPWGRIAYRYPSHRIGCVSLNDDGTCYGDASYIKEWRPYE